VSWSTFGFNVQRTGYNPSETSITAASAPNLHLLWNVNLGDFMIAQPVEAAGVNVGGVSTNVIYEGTEHGDFYALRARDGSQVWHRNLGSVQTTCSDMPDGVFGIGGAATISFTGTGTGVVYVAGGDGAVHALDLATGAEEPGWPVKEVFAPAHEHVWSALNLFGGNLYVTTASYCDHAPYHGKIAEIDVVSHAITSRFYPAGPPSGGVSGGGIWGYGGVAIDPSNAHVFTATGNALTTPETHIYSDAVVELSSSLGVLGFNAPSVPGGSDLDFGATPVPFRPAGCPVTLVAAEHKTGNLFIYTEGAVGSGPRQVLQMASSTDFRFIGVPAWDPVTNMLYVSSGTDSAAGTFRHGLVALKAGSNCSLSLAWQQSVGQAGTSVSSPMVANGVVYYGDGRGGHELAFNAATGAQLWSSGATTSWLFAAPTIVNGKLLTASWNGHLYAFGVGKG
jgi:outer membrane protein assembly factor BamB